MPIIYSHQCVPRQGMKFVCLPYKHYGTLLPSVQCGAVYLSSDCFSVQVLGQRYFIATIKFELSMTIHSAAMAHLCGMVNVDLYSTIVTKVSNALGLGLMIVTYDLTKQYHKLHLGTTCDPNSNTGSRQYSPEPTHTCVKNTFKQCLGNCQHETYALQY